MRWSDQLSSNLILVCIIGVYLLLAGLYAVYTPAWQAPDEPAHYNYVRYLAENGSLPVLHHGDYPHAYLEQIKAARFPPHMSVEPIRYEFWQPPLYYAMAASVYWLFEGALIPLRLFSAVLGAGVVALAYVIVLAVRPEDTKLALGTSAFVAFVPMHLTMMASVNNDALAELLLAAVVLRLIRLAGEPGNESHVISQPAYLISTGLLLGLGLVTKATVYIAIPLAAIALALSGCRLRMLARRALTLFAPAIALAIPWYARNITIYGWPDLLGTRNHEAVVVGQLRTSDYLASVGWLAYVEHFVTTSFHSFWGQFGWMAVPMDARTYLGLGLLSTLMIVGCGLAIFRASNCPILYPSPKTILLGLWLTLTMLVYLYYNLALVQFQGRYLFPALIPIGLLGTLGIGEILSRRWAWLGATICGIAIAVMTINGIFQGDLDRWGLLIVGSATLFLAARRRVPVYLDGWVLAAPFAGLAGLSVYSLFALVVPYLSP